MALDDDTPLPSIRPHSTPQLPLSTSQLPSKSTSKPPRPIRKRSASTPPTPTDQNDQFRCAGVTKAGKRCVRIVKTGAPLAQVIGDNQDQDSPALPRFCHQHQKEVLEPSGYYSKKNGEFVNFDGECNTKNLTICCWIIPFDQIGFHNTSKRKRGCPSELKWKNRGPRPMLRGTFTLLRFVVC